MALVRTVAPTDTPVTLAEAKTQLGVSGSTDDTLIEALIAAATSRLDGPQGLGLALVTQTWRQTMDCWPYDGEIRLGLAPVSSITSITYVDAAGDTQTVDAGDYRLVTGDPYLVVPAFGVAWPGHRHQRAAITITFVAGFGDDAAWAAATAYPEMARIKHAILLSVKDLYGSAKRDVSIRSQTLDGVGSVTYETSGAAQKIVDEAMERLLFDLRRRYVVA